MVEKRSQGAPVAKMAPLWERLVGLIAWYDKKAAACQRAYKIIKEANSWIMDLLDDQIATALNKPLFAINSYVCGPRLIC